ncbi:hypothetical protein HPG69_007589 [Diceros bicornis minor]|uniref:Vomeronasal type-1 receptor n=1 Tax=Diceros bicornis minor TaxID=77932 RepID=A0A7J7EFC3_DICBM|nr:hypothetical protein HPG69_007589 [Diceros bicornis minor]
MMADLGWKHFLNDFGCKLIFYVHRVSREVSTGTTCLLSVFQAITISPRNSTTEDLKFSLSNTNITGKKDYGSCYSVTQYNITQSTYAVLVLFCDGFCLGIMIWSSGSMVFSLHRHGQQVQYIHKSNPSPRSSLETTAMQSIPVLVCTFPSLWTPSSIIHVCLLVINSPSL